MITTVTTKKMVSIPASITRQIGIEPGWKLDWEVGPEPDELRVRVIPDRRGRARRLRGGGRSQYSGDDVVTGLVAERESEE